MSTNNCRIETLKDLKHIKDFSFQLNWIFLSECLFYCMMLILNFINNFKCWNCPLLLFACQVKFNFAQQNPMIKECALNNQEHILFHSRFATALRIMIIIIIVIRIHLSAMEMNWLYCWIEPKFLLCRASGLCVISLSILNVSKIVAIEILVLISYYHVI